MPHRLLHQRLHHQGREGKELAGIAGMKDAGVVLLTDDGSPVGNPRVLRRAMEYARGFDLPFASHAETMELSGNGAMNEGRISYKLGIPGIPPESEEICIDRDIRIARLAGARLHIQHVTTYRGLLIIKRAKEDGCAVTCEVSPHHLIFNEEDITGYDANYKMNPPLRTKADNEGLLQALIDGDFDIIATDHAPHSELEKANDFASAPFGITGLETALPSLYHHFIKPGVFGWDLVVRRYCVEPRKIIGVPPAEIKAGARANFILFDPARQTTFDREFTKSKSTNTPFFNRSLDGMVARVVLDDETLLAR
ncbi:MAG: dihydroorotase [Verrucomicrobiales bacterium]